MGDRKRWEQHVSSVVGKREPGVKVELKKTLAIPGNPKKTNKPGKTKKTGKTEKFKKSRSSKSREQVKRKR